MKEADIEPLLLFEFCCEHLERDAGVGVQIIPESKGGYSSVRFISVHVL